MTKVLVTFVDSKGDEVILRLPPETQIPVGKVMYLGDRDGSPVLEIELSAAWISRMRQQMKERGLI